VAEAEGVGPNHLVNAAVAEKLSAMRTESYFREPGARADIPRAIEILTKGGAGNPRQRGFQAFSNLRPA